ncbi:MAG TPA: hypothetical protein VKB64_00305 [Gaiellaceae bacterium]|nr:hypothetical protein [Gaiellaceae bacterium]
MSPDLWVPGAAQPSLDDFVARIHRLIEQYTGTHDAARSHVEVELADGERLTVLSLSAEPGFGFLTLALEGEQVIVPVGAIRRITLGPADEDRQPGFALPAKGTEGSGARKGAEPAA